MTVAARNIAIEKNRAALLRIVRCWLMIAMVFGSDRVLPRRIGLWVSDIIFTAEKAVYYLQIASGYRLKSDAMPVQRYERLTIRTVIYRLKTVKRALIRLKPGSGGFAERGFCFKPSQASNCPRNAYMRGGLHMLAIFNSRAPPFP